MRSFCVSGSLFVTVFSALVTTNLVSPAAEATYCVSQSHPSAADANPGTQAQPWKTLGRTAAAVSAGDTVQSGTGVHRETLRSDRD